MTWSRRPFWKKWPKHLGATSISTSKPKNTGTLRQGLWWGEPWGGWHRNYRPQWGQHGLKRSQWSLWWCSGLLSAAEPMETASLSTQNPYFYFLLSTWHYRVLCIGKSTLRRKFNKPKKKTSGSKRRSFFIFVSMGTNFLRIRIRSHKHQHIKWWLSG